MQEPYSIVPFTSDEFDQFIVPFTSDEFDQFIWLTRKQIHDKKYWDDKNHLIIYVKWVEQQLKIQKLEDWYKVLLSHIDKLPGINVIKYHLKKDIYDFIKSVYPEHKWYPWLFLKPPNDWTQNPVERQRYIEWFAKQNNIKNQDGWYKITTRCISANKGSSILHFYNNSNIQMISNEVKDYNSWYLGYSHLFQK